jgi:hypothetical protein
LNSLCPAEDTHTKKDNWFLIEKGRNKVLNESQKIIKYVNWGAIMDDEISHEN